MTATSRELVYQTLNFDNPERAPRQLWLLPWATEHCPNELENILKIFPPDIVSINGHLREIPPTKGEMFKVGTYVDEWGCVFENAQDGIQGLVKVPLIKNWSTDVSKIRFPREWFTVDPEQINRDCIETDKFTLAGCCPRPFERLQFIRGTENLYLDLLNPPKEMTKFMKTLHEFYCELLELWAETHVDGLTIMDDWGSQSSLLIQVDRWREYFKPMYRDYIEIAHSYGKKIFMHSDGHILGIYPDLIELGLDAINSQLFCMGIENLKPFAGRITFWGEIDRQHLLPSGSTEDIDQAVRKIYQNLWTAGGCIAQCEFGPNARPENVYQVFLSWDNVSRTNNL